MPCNGIKIRHISELSATPRNKLTQDQIDHIEEYLTLKNHAKSAKDVDIKGAVNHVLSNMDYYLGVPGVEDAIY
jgi:hypothetical protein